MKKFEWRSLACAAALGVAALLPAQAGTVTFEDVAADSIFGDGDTFSSGGFAFRATSLFTPPGGLVGTASGAVGFAFGVAPTNADGQFYSGLNDGGVTMTTTYGSILLIKGFDLSFLPALAGFYDEGDSPALVIARFVDADGNAGEEAFGVGGADVDGLFAFRTVSGAELGGLSQPLRSVTFSACHADQFGLCVNPIDNLGQFSLDNIRAEIPEPGVLLLAALGLGLCGATRRRSV
jgi:hypothetical protein